MGKLVSKWIMVIMAACISLSAAAYGDDDKKSCKKNQQIQLKIDNKKPSKITKTEKEDTLVYDKKAVDDTLTFDEKKPTDDTLIFADDEMNYKVKSKTNNGSGEFSLMKTEKVIALNPVIFPNPSFGQSLLEINAPDNSITEIAITSIDGTLIKKENTSAKSYELKDLAVGIYIVTIRNGNQIIQKRLFVK